MLKQLLESRKKAAATIKGMAERQDKWTGEDEAAWKTVNEEYDQLSRQIDVAQRAEQVAHDQERRTGAEDLGRNPTGHEGRGKGGKGKDGEGRDRRNRGKPTEEQRALALQAWCRHQSGLTLGRRHREAAEACRVNPSARTLAIPLASDYRAVRSQFAREGRAQSVGSDTAGGFTVPGGFVNSLERAMLDFSGVRQVAEVMRTESGNDIDWPTTNDTGNEGEQLGENQQVGEKDVTFGSLTIKAYKYGSKLVRVSSELLQDSAFDLATVLGSLLGERLGRVTNRKFTVGTGAAEPKGIATAATVGKTCAAQLAIAADEILDLIHSVDPAYRTTGCGFMMHDQIMLAVRKLKDGNGAYIWQPGLQAGEPELLFKYPITLNQHMASAIAASAKTMLFGQLSKYKVRDVGSLRLKRLVERYGEYDQEGFVAFVRCDGALLDAGTHPVKAMQQAA